MATTAKSIVPQQRKPLSKTHKAKLVSALAEWRANMTDEEREAWKAQNRATQQQRWANMSERERKARLAGVKAWQAEQRAAKRAAAKAKPAPKPGSKAAPRKGTRATEVSESPARAGARKAAAK